jgi:hypothetical protein
LDPGDADERHRGEVVDLVGLRGAQRVDQRAVVEQVALVKGDAIPEVLDALELLGRGAPHHAVDLITLVEQQLREERPILAGDAGDQGALAHTTTSVALGHSPFPLMRASRLARRACPTGTS